MSGIVDNKFSLGEILYTDKKYRDLTAKFVRGIAVDRRQTSGRIFYCLESMDNKRSWIPEEYLKR